jgi:N-acetylglucosaminyldiphosphoundecaprenol N-acetyl-beta-D-mannosaminyltransferase
MVAEALERTSQSDGPGADPVCSPELHEIERVSVWGLRLARLTAEGTLDAVDRLIARGEPAYFITANLHYAMLSDRDARLGAVNRRAAFIVADGMPLVWYSRLLRRPLPERVAGSDLIYLLSERAAQRGYRLFLLGAGPGVAEQAAAELCRCYPGLRIAGIEAPELAGISPGQHAALVGRIRRARPDLLLAALGQPKGELWLAENYLALGVPVCVQLGASFDFVAGRIRRAPRWTHRVGLEWVWRMAREPRRLVPRYLADAVFLVRAGLRDALGLARPSDPATAR